MPYEAYLSASFSITRRNSFVHQEGSAFRAEGEFAKWPVRILGKALPYYSTIDRGVPEDGLLSMIRGCLYGCDNTGVMKQ